MERIEKKRMEKIERLEKEREDFEEKQRRRLMAKQDDWRVEKEKQRDLRIARSMGTLRNEKCVQERDHHRKMMDHHKMNKEKTFFAAQ